MAASLQRTQHQLDTECAMDKASALISVIIPNYNHARYLGDAITSVLNQTYGNVEIIVVDDGSTDESRTVAARFGDRIRYIWQENQGLSAARNMGIRAAKGEYIGLLDADDMYEPHCLKTFMSHLEMAGNADGIYCGYRFVDQANRALGQGEARQVSAADLYSVLLTGNFLVPESMLVHRCCYAESGPFDITLTACEDWDMWLRITRRYTIIGTTALLTRHRVLPGSMSSDPIRMLNNRLAVLQKHLGPEPADGEQAPSERHMAYGRAYLTSTVEYLQYGDEERAYQCLKAMAKNCPELLTHLDTFYELGCGDQPKGYRGHFATLDIERNAQMLTILLKRLFAEPDMRDALGGYRSMAHANMYIALGLLSYGAQRMHWARHFFRRAVRFDISAGLDRDVVVTYAKSLFGQRGRNWLRALRSLPNTSCSL